MKRDITQILPALAEKFTFCSIDNPEDFVARDVMIVDEAD
jgi:hypothetical protein